MVQLERIKTTMEQRQDKKEKSRDNEEDRDKEEGSKNGFRESQKKRTLLSASCWNSCFVLFFYFNLFFCNLNI